jgi:membrane fusion protein, multidrug efflux system
MKTSTRVAVAALVIVIAGAAAATRSMWSSPAAVAQAPAPRVVPVEVAKAVRKPSPVLVEALGTVTPIQSVAVHSRVDSEITKVHFPDGAVVQESELLFTLDSRAVEAQIKQAEGNLARDRAQLAGAERDIRRYTALIQKNATPITNLDNALTQADIYRAAIDADEGALENLKVQLSYCVIRAPISGRIGPANVKVGNFVRASDVAALATINQIAPIYINFAVPQRLLPSVRRALAAGTAEVIASVPGDAAETAGRLTMIDNNIDPTTGMVAMRATMENAEQILWPGALVETKLSLRVEDAVVVPAAAIQSGQAGNFVFVIKDDIADVRPVKIARVDAREAVLQDGVEPDEVVVVNGQLLLMNGTKVAPRETKLGSR